MFVDGKRIETLWIPPSERQRGTIVMLHGGLGCIALWKDRGGLLKARVAVSSPIPAAEMATLKY